MKATVNRWLMRIKQKKLIRSLLIVYLTYLALSLLLIQPLVNWGGNILYQQQTGRPLAYSFIFFNPFTLSLQVKNPLDIHPDQSMFWSASKIQMNFSLIQSLLTLAPTLDSIELEGFEVNLRKVADGNWSFSDILQHQRSISASQPAPADSELPAFAIDRVALDIRAIQFKDDSGEEPFEFSVEDIQFEWVDFSTVKELGQKYHFHARIGEGGEVGWQGTISLKAGKSEGELSLDNIALKPAWQYLKSRVNFNLDNGTASLSGNYKVDWKNELVWSVEQSRFAVDNLAISNRQNATAGSHIQFDTLAFTGVDLSSHTRLINIAAIDLTGLDLKSWSHAEKSGLLELFVTASENQAENSSAATTSPESTPWSAQIKSVDLKAAKMTWKVVELDNKEFVITPIQFNATDIRTDGKTPAQLLLKASINERTRVDASGSINPLTIDGHVLVDLQHLPLQIINPLLHPHLNAEVLTGELNTKARIQLGEGAPTQVLTTGEVTSFTLRPLTAPEDLIRWSTLGWSETQVDMQGKTLVIPLLELLELDSQFIISQSGTTNLQALYPEADVDAQAKTLTEQKSAAEIDDEWMFDVKKLVLTRGSFRFNDQSLTPNFTAAVQEFSGELNNLSSNAATQASFDFQGNVDGYAPVTLTGKAQAFQSPPKLDAMLNFENLDLGGFSGYSSTYAGWRIDRGLLTANLHYRLAEGRILGDNHIEMDQLQLGEKVDSATAADIPLRLALALLTDANGLATLDIKLSGNPSDPSFDLGKVIRTALRNTLVKVVKSPFSMLGKMIGTDEDLGSVKFNSGSKQLLSSATRKLTLLEEALTRRPQLRVEIRGQYDQVSDKRGLQVAQIKKILMDEGLTSADIKEKNPLWQKAIAREYAKLDLPSSRKISADEQYEKLLQSRSVTEQQLLELAVKRSLMVKQFLVEHLQVDNGRVLINSEIDCHKENTCAARLVHFDLADLSPQL